jgi:calmodulin
MADQLTTEQIAEIKETFSLFDKSGGGSITLDEMAIIIRALGQTPTEAEIEEMKRQADPEGTGLVDFPEFLSIFARFQKDPVTEQEILNAFDELDESKKGLITIKKLRHLMSTCAELMSEDEIEKMIHYASPDQDGNINYRDFVRLMMSK